MVAGGVGFLLAVAVAAIAVTLKWGGALGVVIFATGAYLTFRWFSRDGHELRLAARLKRGALFASPFLVLPVFVTLMAMATPGMHLLIKAERLADIAMVIFALAPFAFGIGALTAK
jgi:hypothetical protein